MGAQVPVSKSTLGNKLRRRRGLQPPLGQYYIASFLNLLGVDTYVFNLALGEKEREELEEKIKSLKDRLWFLSFSSNFLGEEELDSLYYLASLLEPLRKEGIAPRIVGGGMGVFFSKDIYLRYSPIEIVIGRYGEPSFGDMIFSSDYRGPYDLRDNVLLFSHIPNLHISVNKGSEFNIYSTEVVPLSLGDRRVLANAFDISKMSLEQKYWSKGIVMGICAPDDLNLPLELALPDNLQNEKEKFSELETFNLMMHPSNYIFKPKTVKVMSTFGNCQRGCKFCQYTHYDESLYFVSVQEVINQLNNAVKAYPDMHMFVFDDDDFLIREQHCRELIEQLRNNKFTQGKVFYVETAPVTIKYDILSSLREVGFRAILIGIESTSERIVRHTGKLKPQDSFEEFINAPKIAYDSGFFTRVTSIPFYPIVTEEDLIQIIKGLTDYINYGITVSVFPFVQAMPGSDFVNERKYEFSKKCYKIPDGSGRTLDLLEYVIPDDQIIREIAFESIKNTALQLNKILQSYNIVDDYPMSLGVLAFFRSIIQSWLEISTRLTPDETLKELCQLVDNAVIKLVKRHFVQLDVQRTIQYLADGRELDAYHLIEQWLKDDTLPFVITGLRMYLDFGDNDEVIYAAQLVQNTLRKYGITDKYLNESLVYCSKRPLSIKQRNKIDEIISQCL